VRTDEVIEFWCRPPAGARVSGTHLLPSLAKRAPRCCAGAVVRCSRVL